jgi:hypothetical protein
MADVHRGKAVTIRDLGKNPALNSYLKVPDSVPQSAGGCTPKCRGLYPKVPDSAPQGAGAVSQSAGYGQAGDKRGCTSKCRGWIADVRDRPQSAGGGFHRERVPAAGRFRPTLSVGWRARGPEPAVSYLKVPGHSLGRACSRTPKCRILSMRAANGLGTISRRNVLSGQLFPKFVRSQFEELAEAHLG